MLFMLLFGQSPDEGNGKLRSPVAGPATTKVTMKPKCLVWTEPGNDALRLCFVTSYTVQRCSGNTGSYSCIILLNFGTKTGLSLFLRVVQLLWSVHWTPCRLGTLSAWMSTFVTYEPSYFGLPRVKVLFSVPIMTHDLFTCSQLPRDDNHVSETFRWSLLPHCLVAFVNNISACLAMHGISLVFSVIFV